VLLYLALHRLEKLRRQEFQRRFGLRLMAARILRADRLVYSSDYPSFAFDPAVDTVRTWV
jgi:hypothetical protein